MTITREIYVTRKTLPNPIEYVQGTNALPIAFTLADYTIPDGSEAKVYVEKPSGYCEYDIATAAENTVLIDVKDTMFDEVGISNIQIKLTKDNKTLITFDYPVRVSKNRVAGNIPQSGDNSDLIDDLLARGGPAVEAAEAAAARANAAADRLEGTDVGTLANELDAHTGSQVNTDLGVHGMRINGGQLQVGDDSSWRNAIDKTYTNPQELPYRSTLVSMPPGVYIGKNPKDLDLAGNTQYILVVCKSGTATSRSVTFPLEDKRYTYSVTNKKWVQPRDVVEEGDSGTLHYIKYSDGTAECWGTIQKSVGFYVKTSSLHLTENSEIETPIPYPEHASISVDEPWCWCNYNEANGKNIKFRVFYADLTDPGKKTLSVHIKVTGHWK